MHYNLLNECMNCQMSSTEPKVGMLATMFCGSDRYAMVVTEVINNKKIKIDYLYCSDFYLTNNTYTDNKTKCDFLNDAELIKFVMPNKNRTGWEGTGKIYTYRKNKRWMPFKSECWGTCSIHLGKAENYRDPSF